MLIYDSNNFGLAKLYAYINVCTKGNSSVATIPILLHGLLEKQHDESGIQPGDLVVFASVDAGMHVNAILYQF